MAEKEYTVKFTAEEIEAVIGWASMAGVGFVYGGAPDPKDKNVVAVEKLRKAQAGAAS